MKNDKDFVDFIASNRMAGDEIPDTGKERRKAKQSWKKK